jgi:hypothetical protein
MSQGAGYLMLEEALARPELLAPPPAVVPRLAWAGRLTGLGSEPKFGKSTLTGQAVACLARGVPFLDEPLARARTLWIALDEPLADVVRRLADFGATGNVALVTQRPGMAELLKMIRNLEAKLLVVDTMTEFAAGLVEDGNSGQQWQPIYSGLRNVLTETGCAGLVLDHTGKSNPHSLVGSLQKSAGCDLVLTMTDTEDSPNIRSIRARGRIPCSNFSIAWDGERNSLHMGELSLETRVYHVVVATPGLSRTKIRERVTGKAKLVDAALDALERRRLIEDRGGTNGHAYHVKRENPGTGSGRGWDRPPLELVSDVGHCGTGAGQGSGQTPCPYPLTGVGRDRVRNTGESEEETERLAIEAEQAR